MDTDRPCVPLCPRLALLTLCIVHHHYVVVMVSGWAQRVKARAGCLAQPFVYSVMATHLQSGSKLVQQQPWQQGKILAKKHVATVIARAEPM